jgi:hypothetical protein
MLSDGTLFAETVGAPLSGGMSALKFMEGAACSFAGVAVDVEF